MAGNTKRFDQASEVRFVKTVMHESVAASGSVISGTYAAPSAGGDTSNIKNYTHGMFQSVFDYPYNSSSANHLFDLTNAYSTNSALYGSTSADNETKKVNLYNQMAQILVGFDATGSIRRFDNDGDLTGGAKTDEAIFINLSRLLGKDGLQKGTFNLKLGVSGGALGYASPFGDMITISDVNGTSSYFSNSPAGEYGILYASNSAGTPLDGFTGSTQASCGLLYYQQNVVMLSASMFMPTGSGGLMSASMFLDSGSIFSRDSHQTLVSSSISGTADGLRHRIYNLSFNNTTVLNSTVYFCNIAPGEFNYSSNPTYLNGSKVRVKGDNPNNLPRAFITSVGLYNAADQLVAVAKLSEPIENSPLNSPTIKVRLDY
jgi:hypothetical protein